MLVAKNAAMDFRILNGIITTCVVVWASCLLTTATTTDKCEYDGGFTGKCVSYIEKYVVNTRFIFDTCTTPASLQCYVDVPRLRVHFSHTFQEHNIKVPVTGYDGLTLHVMMNLDKIDEMLLEIDYHLDGPLFDNVIDQTFNLSGIQVKCMDASEGLTQGAGIFIAVLVVGVIIGAGVFTVYVYITRRKLKERPTLITNMELPEPDDITRPRGYHDRSPSNDSSPLNTAQPGQLETLVIAPGQKKVNLDPASKLDEADSPFI